MRDASHKKFMCNKLCNYLFSEVLTKRQALDGTSTLAGIRASRFLTLELLWTGRGCPESGRYCVLSKLWTTFRGNQFL
jgi:hypothetical protein